MPVKRNDPLPARYHLPREINDFIRRPVALGQINDLRILVAIQTHQILKASECLSMCINGLVEVPSTVILARGNKRFRNSSWNAE